MRPTVVVDVGNTRIKWGLCQDGQVAQVSSLPPDDSTLWAEQAAHWQLTPGCVWVLTGVVPARCDALADWLRQQGYEVHLLLKAADLPLKVDLARPDHVGIDRLLDAVAANSRRPPGVAAILIDAGSAVTMDLVDSDGVFRGGAILPGLRLMINALHDYTALLPLIDIPRQTPVVPGVSTPLAMEVGVFWAVAGGVTGAPQCLSPTPGAPSRWCSSRAATPQPWHPCFPRLFPGLP